LYKISICAIVKNEVDIKEWIAYHRAIGFDHLYIYDNNDEPLDLNCDFCTFVKFPGETQQINAYKHFIQNYSNQTEYVCMIDGDEYVVFKEKYKDIKEIIQEFPEDLDALILNWKQFINKKERSDGLLFESNKQWQEYNFCKGYKQPIKRLKYNKNIKTIAKTNTIKDIESPHYFIHNKNAQVYCGDLINKHSRSNNETNDNLANAIFQLETEPLIWINHYYIKSLEEFKYKCEIRGRPTVVEKKNYQKELQSINDGDLREEPTEILNWVDRVKQIMEKL
jgi:predicted MPP superfamily phosphohydrolase